MLLSLIILHFGLDRFGRYSLLLVENIGGWVGEKGTEREKREEKEKRERENDSKREYNRREEREKEKKKKKPPHKGFWSGKKDFSKDWISGSILGWNVCCAVSCCTCFPTLFAKRNRKRFFFKKNIRSGNH